MATVRTASPHSEPGRRLGARLQAQPGRADQAREEPARDPRRAARPDRRRLRAHAGGGPRPPEVVGRSTTTSRRSGTFMLRIKLAGGRVSPAGAAGDRRDLERASAAATGELTTRQNVQLHWLELGALPEVFERLHAAGLTSAGGCGDAVRNITGCPVAGARRRTSSSTPSRSCDAGGGVLLRQPRLLEPAAEAQDHDRRLRRPLQRARDQLRRARRRDPRGERGLRRPRSAAGSRPFRASPATSASSSPRTRPSRCCARSSTPGRRTSATASRG